MCSKPAVTCVIAIAIVCAMGQQNARGQTDWTKRAGEPLLKNGSPTQWDGTGAGIVSIMYDDGMYKAWYVGQDSIYIGRIGYATSPDGINWVKDMAHNPVLDVGPPGSWDEANADHACILKIGGEYKMWYSGEDQNSNRIGYATSPDGITWTKDGVNNPVLGLGPPGSWDDSEVLHPYVIFDGATYHMWYNAFGQSSQNTGYATSPDGINWTKYPGNPVFETGSAGTWDDYMLALQAVIKEGSTYHMWYGAGDGTDEDNKYFRIGYASSTNGIDWNRYVGNPIIDKGPSGDWDSIGVLTSAVLLDSAAGVYRMWYGGIDGAVFQTGYATAPTGAASSGGWQALGGGFNGPVRSLLEYDGELIAGGDFTEVGGVSANRIARWVAGNWHPLSSGMDGSVYALTEYQGSLIAGGDFTTAGGTPAGRVASWDGSQWHALGLGTDTIVYALAEYDGDLIVAGNFELAGGAGAGSIARWDGLDWNQMGSGTPFWVSALLPYNGDLIAGGLFASIGGVVAPYIGRWDGVEWHPLGSGLNDEVTALATFNGDLIAGGTFLIAGGGIGASRVASWNGSSWSALGSGTNLPVNALAAYDTRLIAGGSFFLAGDGSVNYVAKWDGAAWSPAGSGVDGQVLALTKYHDSLIVGGDFTSAGGGGVLRIASWYDPCCEGRRGDVDKAGVDPMEIDSTDLGTLVNFLFSPAGAVILPCPGEADVDGAGGPFPIDSSDLGTLVNLLFSPPGSITIPDCP